MPRLLAKLGFFIFRKLNQDKFWVVFCPLDSTTTFAHMIDYQKITLQNGLRVIVNEDQDTPMAAVNLLYEVGSRDEDPERTGFAHLFEHLMFAGSKNAPEFDAPLQAAGIENNAFTTNDQTNFYEIAPAQNLETVFWLESDRMLALNISEKKLDVQRKVVVEEFKETCLNEPYGDAWHHLSEMCYPRHPYRWPVIGLKFEHIEQASLADVRSFYQKFYRPDNAILSVSGKVKADEVFQLAEKWFGAIPAGKKIERNYEQDAPQTAAITRVVEADVPMPAIFMAFRMAPRLAREFYTTDLLSDILANGQSSRLYRRLLKEQKIFSQIDANLTATLDAGLFIIEGKPSEGVSIETATAAIWQELEDLKNTVISERELLKIQRRYESEVIFSEANALTKAQNLGSCESLGDLSLVNSEVNTYLSIAPRELQQTAQLLFRPEAACTLIYAR